MSGAVLTPQETTMFNHPTGRRQKREPYRFGCYEGEDVAYVPLTQSQWAIVSIEDFPEVSKYLWHAAKRERGTYATGWIGGREVDLHRLIPVDNSDLPLRDHKNQNPLDCRRSNLRACTYGENRRNVRKTNTRSNPYKGVTLEATTGRWRATLRHNRISYNGGMHATAELAARAYDALAIKYHGEFACLNFQEVLCLAL
jgi:hypothetical protein